MGGGDFTPALDVQSRDGASRPHSLKLPSPCLSLPASQVGTRAFVPQHGPGEDVVWPARLCSP